MEKRVEGWGEENYCHVFPETGEIPGSNLDSLISLWFRIQQRGGNEWLGWFVPSICKHITNLILRLRTTPVTGPA